jgi:HEPN domain-containing protein
VAITRTGFQNLAHEKLDEAKILLDAGKWTGAYYLAGYAVECGLKACIAKLFRSDEFPEKSFSDKCYIHDIKKLIELAGLKPNWEADRKANKILYGTWGVVEQWHEGSRYEIKTQANAQELYNAITANPDGVLPWIKLHW